MTRTQILTTSLVMAVGFPVFAESDAPDGETLFATHCAACHGESAMGDGPSAKVLDTPPRDLTKIADRRDGVWPMLEIMSIIDGYTKRTNPRENMPTLDVLTEGPMVDFDTGNGLTTKVPARLIAVVEYLESIQSPAPEVYIP